MKRAKKLVASITLFCFLILSTATKVQAEEYCVDNGGCGYDTCCRTSTLAPAIALGTIVLVAIVALAIQNLSGHAHCHAEVHD